MRSYNIALLPGDGIGPEVTNEAVLTLNCVGEHFGFAFNFEQADIGGCAIDAFGDPFPDKSLEVCKRSDAVLLGAVGGSKWDSLPGDLRPEKGLLRIRSELGLFANLRPTMIYDALKEASPLKNELLQGGLDILVVRELTGGIYFGKRGRNTNNGVVSAYDTEEYSVDEIDRIARVAFQAAQKRKKKLCSVDKANVLESSRLWRERVTELSKYYPDVELVHMYVDNAAMQIVRRPSQFDTIVTGNMFGDILSDEASQISGSIGMLPSASLGDRKFGMYEPIHGSAPDIAGKNIANPLASILSTAMMLRYTFGENDAASAIENAVTAALNSGCRTQDIAESGKTPMTTSEMGEAVRAKLFN